MISNTTYWKLPFRFIRSMGPTTMTKKVRTCRCAPSTVYRVSSPIDSNLPPREGKKFRSVPKDAKEDQSIDQVVLSMPSLSQTFPFQSMFRSALKRLSGCCLRPTAQERRRLPGEQLLWLLHQTWSTSSNGEVIAGVSQQRQRQRKVTANQKQFRLRMLVSVID